MRVQLLTGNRAQVALPADHLVSVGMELKGRRHHGLGKPPLRVVLVALALRDNHAALALDLVGIEQRIHHPIRLDPQAQLDPIGRQRFEVGGVVAKR